MKTLWNQLDYRIPEHALNPGYALGGLSAMVFGVMIVTGLILAFHYTPSIQGAHGSVQQLLHSEWGTVIRSLHSWSSQAFVVLLLLHMSRIVLTKSFLGDRKWTWYVGVVLLVLILWAFFTGTVLKWDQEAYEAHAHRLAVLDILPGGEWIRPFYGREKVVLRTFVLHIALIPLLIAGFMGLHFVLIKTLDISPRVPGSDPTSSRWFSHHLRRLTGWGTALLGLLLFLASTWQPPFLSPPVAGVEWTKPPWPFYPLYFMESWFGFTSLIWGPLVGLGGLIGLPWLSTETPKPDLCTWLYLLGLLWILVTSLYVALTPPVQHL